MSLNLLNFLSDSRSRLNAFIMTCPPYISSTCPLMCPRYSCCAVKCFWERFTSTRMIRKEAGMMQSATSVICQLMVNIIIMIPTSVVTEVMICVTLWFRDWFRTSISLVTRESTSPWLVVSKYFRGSLFILWDMSRRRL